jgi:uncharacterized PurR-regulated membrane protein YhhQ (DUF165 family)
VLYIAIAIYATAMTLANLSIAAFGPAVIVFNAFFLIGLDLALRDFLHIRLRPWQMAVLIGVSGLITFALNADAGRIAVASACAFAAAALLDWLVFSVTPGTWVRRANVSNVAGAAVDSVVFPAIAFGGLDPKIVLTMFAAKVAGGAMWAWLINRWSART